MEQYTPPTLDKDIEERIMRFKHEQAHGCHIEKEEVDGNIRHMAEVQGIDEQEARKRLCLAMQLNGIKVEAYSPKVHDWSRAEPLNWLDEMKKLDEAWKSGKKVDCPKMLCGYLKGIVLNDHTKDETDRKVRVLLCDEAIAYIEDRLANPLPEYEAEYLHRALAMIRDERGWYVAKHRLRKPDLNYDLLKTDGDKLYGWNK